MASKMLKRSKRKKKSKLLTFMPEIKTRKPVSQKANQRHKNKTDYDRRSNRKIVINELNS